MADKSKPKVFISYSHNDNQVDYVKKLADIFRDYGIDCRLDKYKPVNVWNDWMDDGIHNADYILVVCGATYVEKFQTRSNSGVYTEAEKIRDRLAKTDNDISKICRIFFGEINDAHTPRELIRCNATNCNDYDSLNSLYKHITGQNEDIPNIGEMVENLPHMPFSTPANLQKTENILTSFLNKIDYKVDDFIKISKLYLEPEYRKNLVKIQTLREAILYMDGLVIDDKYTPLACVVNHIYREQNMLHKPIKSWLDEHYDNSLCPKFEENLEGDRIILDFEKSENSNRVDVTIRYYIDGAFLSNEGKIFKDELLNENFQKKLLDSIYETLDRYQHMEILLPQQYVLEDVKQWSYYDQELYSNVCFTKDCHVNTHIRERVIYVKNSKWIEVGELEKTIEQSMKEMNTPQDEVDKETHEVGLQYKFLPDSARNFYDRAKRKMVVIRCGDKDKLDEFNRWLENNKELPLKELKREVDKKENSYMTLIWSDPKIPLIQQGV